MKKIKIIRIQSRIVIGGPAIHTRILSEKLNPNKYQTILIGGTNSADEKSLVDELVSKNIDCRIIPEMGRDIHFYDDLISFYKLFKIIKQEKPQIVHTHTAKAGALGRFAAYIARVPIIFHTFHGNVFSGYFGNFKTKIFLFLEKILAKMSTKIIVISSEQRKDICERYLIAPAKKTVTIPLGFEWEGFDKKSKNGVSLREHFSINPNKKMIGIVGRLVPIKNHRLFIDVANKILHRCQDQFHFIIIGDGELAPVLKQKCKALGIADSITFAGWQKVNKNLYQEFDLTLLTSNNEGTPVAIIESLAAGIPVISTNVGGVPDIMKNYSLDYLVGRGDVNSFVEKITLHLEKPLVVSEQVQEKIKKYYNFERLVTQIDELYHELL